MERKFNLRHLIGDAVRLGNGFLRRQPARMTSKPLATSGLGSSFDREAIIRHHYYQQLRKNLPSFGEANGSVTIGDVVVLIQNVTTGFPDADRFIGYPFSQITGDLQSTLLTNPGARSATVNWLTDVHEDTVRRYGSLQQETGEWEEKLEETDFEFRGLTAEAAREMNYSAVELRSILRKVLL